MGEISLYISCDNNSNHLSPSMNVNHGRELFCDFPTLLVAS